MMIFLVAINLFLTALSAYYFQTLSEKGIRSVIAISFSFVFSTILFVISLMAGVSFLTFIVFWSVLNICCIYLQRKNLILQRLFSFKIENTDILFLIFLLFAVYQFTLNSIRWGKWDAWAIWTLHAKFLFYSEYWTNLFTTELDWTVPDYPLMLPAIIAIFWNAFGEITPAVPVLAALLSLLGTFILFYCSFKNKVFGLTIVFLLCFPPFIKYASSQYSDVLQGFFILLSSVLLYQIKVSDNKENLFLPLGFVASSSIWVKNEGIIFFFFISLIILINYYNNWRNILKYFIGTLPVLTIFFIFKTGYAPSNYMIAGQSENETIAKIFDFERYIIIFKFFIDLMVSEYLILIILFPIALFSHSKKIFAWPFIILLLTLGSYLSIYIITTRDLPWHLDTSLYRLILQLYPSFIFLFMVLIKDIPIIQKVKWIKKLN